MRKIIGIVLSLSFALMMIGLSAVPKTKTINKLLFP